MEKPIICWWSAGVTSAVACHYAIQEFGRERVRMIYFKIDSAHEDNARFQADCELWYGKPIEIWRSEKYVDQFDVIEKTRYINGPSGARCTLELKKNVRYAVQDSTDYQHQVFGFEYSKKEINRAIRFKEQSPEALSIFPLIENKITKPNALHFLENVVGIRQPTMYSLGYRNNNCIGCVKGGAGYWNKIRKDFPETFDRMAKVERQVGATCLKNTKGRVYLDTLDPEAGRDELPVLPDCGNFCEIEFADREHPMLSQVEIDPRLLRNI